MCEGLATEYLHNHLEYGICFYFRMKTTVYCFVELIAIHLYVNDKEDTENYNPLLFICIFINFFFLSFKTKRVNTYSV